MGKTSLPEIKTNALRMAANKHVTDDENEPLSPLSRLFHNPECNFHIISIIGFKTRLDVEHIKSELPHTLLNHPRFWCLQVRDENHGSTEMKWVRTEVNLDDHVHAPKLKKYNPSFSSDDQLVENYIYNIANVPLNQDKPLWEMHILNDITTKEGDNAISILRLHHSLGDGISLMSHLLSFSRKASNPNSISDIPCPIQKRSFVSDQVLYKGIWAFMQFVWNTIIDVMMLLVTAWFLSDSKTPLKEDKKVSMSPKRTIYRSVHMDDIKFVKNSSGTTINDVVMGVFEAGLTRYLNRRYGNLQGKQNNGREDNLPKGIRLRAVIIFNLRHFSGIQSGKDMLKKGSSVGEWGNKVGYVLYPFNIMKRDDPIQYIHQAKATMDRKKASLESRFSYIFGTFVLKYFNNSWAPSLPSNPTLWISNMIGPRVEITIFGYPVTFIAPTCYGPPTGLMIHVITYMDKLTFVLSMDDQIVPDPQQLCDDLEESLTLIKDAVMQSQKNMFAKND